MSSPDQPRRWQAGSGTPGVGRRPAGYQPVMPQFWAVPGGNAVEDASAIQVGPPVPVRGRELNFVEAIGHQVATALCGVQLNTRQPSHVMPTALSAPFYACSVSDVAVSDGAFVTVAQVFVNSGSNVAIRKLGLQLPFAAAFDDVVWRVSSGASPIEGWDSIGCQVGSIAAPADVAIKDGHAEAARVISIQARKRTAGSINARAVFSGWIDAPRVPGDGAGAWVGD